MDWEAISAVAEVVGVVAIVISLVYLAFQVRGNTQQIERAAQANRTQSWQAVSENFNVWRQMLAMPGNADIWIRGINDLKDLTQEERLLFNNMANSVFWSGWFMYHIQTSEGLMGDVNSNAFRDMFRHPGFREWISEAKKAQLNDDDYGDFLDRVRESVGPERIKPGMASSYSQGEY